MTPYLRACAEALWERRRTAGLAPRLLDPRLPGCLGCPVFTTAEAWATWPRKAEAHWRSKEHCRALVARAAAGEPVPEDVREVMRLGPPYPTAAVGFLDTKDWPEPWLEAAAELDAGMELLAHAIAPGARRDSWLLRLDTAEGVRYGVIVELPAVLRCVVCNRISERILTDDNKCCAARMVKVSKPLHLRETVPTLADALDLLGHCGEAQVRRVVAQLEAAGVELHRRERMAG